MPVGKELLKADVGPTSGPTSLKLGPTSNFWADFAEVGPTSDFSAITTCSLACSCSPRPSAAASGSRAGRSRQHLEWCPIVTSQRSSTTLYQVLYHIQSLFFFESDNRIYLERHRASGSRSAGGGAPAPRLGPSRIVASERKPPTTLAILVPSGCAAVQSGSATEP